jgi:hypothetical protein
MRESQKELLALALREYPTWGDAYIAERSRRMELEKALRDVGEWLSTMQGWPVSKSDLDRVLPEIERALSGGTPK